MFDSTEPGQTGPNRDAATTFSNNCGLSERRDRIGWVSRSDAILLGRRAGWTGRLAAPQRHPSSTMFRVEPAASSPNSSGQAANLSAESRNSGPSIQSRDSGSFNFPKRGTETGSTQANVEIETHHPAERSDACNAGATRSTIHSLLFPSRAMRRAAWLSA